MAQPWWPLNGVGVRGCQHFLISWNYSAVVTDSVGYSDVPQENVTFLQDLTMWDGGQAD